MTRGSRLSITRASRRATVGVGLVASALLLLLCPRAPLSRVAAGSAATAQALAHGSIVVVDAVPDAFTTVVRDGQRYVAQPLGPALLFVPAALAHVERPARLALAGAFCAALFGGVLFALFYRRARALASPTAAAWATLFLAGTFAGVAGRQTDGMVVATLALFVFGDGVVAAVLDDGDRTAAVALVWRGVAGGLLALCEPASGLLLLVGAVLVVAGPLTRWSAAVPWPRALAVRAAWLAVGLVPLALVGWWHARLIAPPPFATDLGLGLDGLLLSTGKSVFLYAPPLLLLPLCWRVRGFFWRIVLASLILVPVAASATWHGDPAWGPARIAGVVPLLLLSLPVWLDGAWGPKRAGAGVLAVVGLTLQLVGSAVRPESYLHLLESEKNRTGAAGWFAVAADQAHFIPQFSPLGGHAWLLRHLLAHDRHLDGDPPWVLITPAPAHLDDEWQTLYVDFYAADVVGLNGAIDRDAGLRAVWGAATVAELALGLALLGAARRRKGDAT